MSALLPHEILEPARPATHCIIWLHGLGADGHDFVPIVPELRLPSDTAIRFVFPHAPVRPVTINGNMEMRAWYDILRIAEDGMNVAHIEESSRQVEALVREQEAQGIPCDQILLAGFSQGGTIALHTGLRLQQRLAGLVALSTWLPPAPGLHGRHRGPNTSAPVFQAHGRADMVVPHMLGEMTRASLEQLGCDLEWREYDMGHQVCAEQIRDLSAWIQGQL